MMLNCCSLLVWFGLLLGCWSDSVTSLVALLVCWCLVTGLWCVILFVICGWCWLSGWCFLWFVVTLL